MDNLRALVRAAEQLVAGGEPAGLATVVRVEGSSYRRPGARAIFDSRGVQFGVLSGGCLERDLSERAAAVLERGETMTVVYDESADDPVFGLGLGCGGTVEIRLEPLAPALPALRHELETRPPPLLVVFGESRGAAPLVRLAERVGYDVTVVERAAEAEFRAAAGCHAVVMTHHLERDLAIVRRLLAAEVAYVGVLASRGRAERLTRALAADAPPGAGPDPRLHTPVGLDLGAEGPEEIAVAIMAELIGMRAGRLRDGSRPAAR